MVERDRERDRERERERERSERYENMRSRICRVTYLILFSFSVSCFWSFCWSFRSGVFVTYYFWLIGRLIRFDSMQI